MNDHQLHFQTLEIRGSFVYLGLMSPDFEAGQGFGGDAEGDSFSSIENVTGSFGNDILVGNAGDNTLKGGAGQDILDGGEGKGVIDGGEGEDWVDYRSSSEKLDVSLGGDSDTGYSRTDGDTIIHELEA